MSISLTSSDLYDVFKQFGEIESARVLTQKNCAFVNFKYLESAIRAKDHVQSTNLLGPNTRIGFAKVPTAPAPTTTPIPDRDPNEEISDGMVKPNSSENRKLMKIDLLEIVRVLAPEEDEKNILSEGTFIFRSSPPPEIWHFLVGFKPSFYTEVHHLAYHQILKNKSYITKQFPASLSSDQSENWMLLLYENYVNDWTAKTQIQRMRIVLRKNA
jgi:RNA recognition motif-containing protein